MNHLERFIQPLKQMLETIKVLSKTNDPASKMNDPSDSGTKPNPVFQPVFKQHQTTIPNLQLNYSQPCKMASVTTICVRTLVFALASWSTVATVGTHALFSHYIDEIFLKM